MPGSAPWVDAIVVAGRLLGPSSVEGNRPRAVLIRGEQIVEVVDADGAVEAGAAGGARVIDLSSHTVTPGFFDAHNHQPSAARDELETPSCHAVDIQQLSDILRAECALREDGAWVVTERNLSRAQLAERRFPTLQELDAVSERHPIAVRFGAHAAVLNSLALEVTGLRGLREDPPVGRLERDDSGAPLGPVHEYGALRYVDAGREATDERAHVGALAAVQRQYVASGITSVRVPGIRPGELSWYQQLADVGHAVRNRVFAAVRIDPNLAASDKLEYIASWQVRTGFGDDRLAVDGLKLFVDGGVGDDPQRPDTLFLSESELTRVVAFASARGWSIACHAITEPAIDIVLGAYEATKHHAQPSARFVIEHGLFITDGQLRRAAHLDVWLSTQPALLEVNAHLLEKASGGPAPRACPLRSALDVGVRVALGSDWNATPGTRIRPYAPVRSMAIACRSGSEGVTSRTALRLHTRAPAELVGHRSLGLVAAGAPADLVAFEGLLDADELMADGSMRPTDVFVGGHHVVADGAVAAGEFLPMA